MGRKGVSKRKPNQTKSKPFSSDKTGSSVSSVMQAVESKPVKAIDTGRASTDRKKSSKNG